MTDFGRRPVMSDNGKYYNKIRGYCGECRSEYNYRVGIENDPYRVYRNGGSYRANRCVECGRQFLAKRVNIIYCSDTCRRNKTLSFSPRKAPEYNLSDQVCVVCENTFVGKNNQKYCSSACLDKKNRERSREYREKHPERNGRGIKRLEVWKKENPKKARQAKKRRKQRKRSEPSTLTAGEWEETLRKFDNRCAYCDVELTEVHQEHFVPVALGGGYTKNNIVPSCPECNADKKHTRPNEYCSKKRYDFIRSKITP